MRFFLSVFVRIFKFGLRKLGNLKFEFRFAFNSTKTEELTELVLKKQLAVLDFRTEFKVSKLSQLKSKIKLHEEKISKKFFF